MPQQTIRIEHVLPAVRALIVQELVERLGHNRAEAARMLNITPAAVSQYMDGKRGGHLVEKIRGSKQLMLTISELANLASERRKSGVEMDFTALIDASYRVMTLLIGEEVHPATLAKAEAKKQEDVEKRRRWLAILRKRLAAEQQAAQRNMGLALWTNNDLVKSLFRQIASDSLRHAEIVASLITYIEGESRPSKIESPNLKELKQIIEDEEAADDPAINELKEIRDPAVQLLLDSIEADENKHLVLLKGLFRSAKTP